MAWNRGKKCKYKYTVWVELEKIASAIAENLPGDVCEKWDFDGDKMVFTMSDKSIADIWHTPQTYYEPEEYEIEMRECVNEEEANLSILSALHGIEDITAEIEIDDESIELEGEYE